MTSSLAQTVLLAVVLVGFPVWDVIVTRRLRAAALAGDIQARTRGYIQTIVALGLSPVRRSR